MASTPSRLDEITTSFATLEDPRSEINRRHPLPSVLVIAVLAGAAGPTAIARRAKFKEELLIVLGTSSSESVLPRMISKLENLGCKESVVGLVVPTGYSFNLDGTCIYLTMAAIFLAQATNTELTLWQQLGIIGILLLTSKGAAGVTGSGFQ